MNSSTFPAADTELLLVYFCDQFFESLPGGEPHAAVFAQHAEDAMHESWQTQVGAWGLGAPADADHIHQVFINDSLHYFHVLPKTYTEFGGDQKIGIVSQLWYRSQTDSAYSSESIRVKSAVAHEFYHGIQWSLDSAKVVNDDWNWFTEAQARFIQSAQYPDEEFSKTGGQIAGLRQYPRDANKYITQYLNKSLRTLSADSSIAGYPYCLFWRFMYEKFLSNSIQIVRDCYAERVGINNSVSQGKLAIDRAIAKYWGPGQANRPRFKDFLQSIDSFAVACYLNDTSFGLWHDPNHVYSPCSLTVNDSFRLGPAETDSILIVDSIPNSYGFDLMQLRLDGNVDTLLVKLSSVSPAVKLRASVVRIFPATPRDTFRVDSLLVSSVHGGAGQIPTHDAKRVCLIITRHDTLDDLASGNDSVRFNVKRAVAVLDSLPISDTVIAGTSFTPRAVVANRGWMKEVFDATFKIGTAYTSTVSCTLDAGGSKVVDFAPWETESGTFATCCYVYIARDTTRGDDTLRGSLAALSNVWQARLGVLAGVSHGGSLAAVGDTLVYALRGGYSKAFYCYDARSNTWATKESLSYAVGHGASLTWDHGAYLYALGGTSPGGNHFRLFRYGIASNSWSEMPSDSLPGNFGAASALAWGGGGYLYAIQGLFPLNTQGFFRYDTAAEKWSQKQDVPKPCSLGASLCWDQAGYMYALCANKSRAFCRYSTSGSWSVMDSTPSAVAHGAALAYNSLDDGIYAWSGATSPTHFWRYNAGGDTWSVRASPPANAGYGGALTGCAGFVYGLRGNGTTEFWRYFPILESRKSLRAGIIAEYGSLMETNSFAISPSPVRGAARVQWQIREPGAVVVRVFDNAGRAVRTVQNGYQAAGRYSVHWDGTCDNGKRAASGIFFYRIDAPGFHKVIKVAALGK